MPTHAPPQFGAPLGAAPRPTDQQVHAAMDAFARSPEFLALPEGRARHDAYVTALNAITGGDIPTVGSGGLFQSIPGQSGLETALTRAIGIGGFAALGGIALAGGTGAAAAGGGAGATGVAPAVAPVVAPVASHSLFAGFAPALLSTGANIYGIVAQKNAASDAAAAQLTSSEAQLAYLRQKDAEDRAQFERTQALNLAQFNAREGRLSPYRNIGEMATRTLSPLLRAPAPYGTIASLARG